MPTFSPIFSTTFTRADEDPLSEGGVWASCPSSSINQFKIVSNQATPENPTSSDDASRYIGAAWPNNQYMRGNLTCNASVLGTGVGFYLRIQAASDSYYRFVISHAAGANAELGKQDPGIGFTQMATWVQSFTDGDQFTFAIQGQVLYVYDKNGVLVKSFDDSGGTGGAGPTSGFGGLACSTSIVSGAIDNVDGGGFTTASAVGSGGFQHPGRGPGRPFNALLTLPGTVTQASITIVDEDSDWFGPLGPFPTQPRAQAIISDEDVLPRFILVDEGDPWLPYLPGTTRIEIPRPAIIADEDQKPFIYVDDDVWWPPARTSSTTPAQAIISDEDSYSPALDEDGWPVQLPARALAPGQAFFVDDELPPQGAAPFFLDEDAWPPARTSSTTPAQAIVSDEDVLPAFILVDEGDPWIPGRTALELPRQPIISDEDTLPSSIAVDEGDAWIPGRIALELPRQPIISDEDTLPFLYVDEGDPWIPGRTALEVPRQPIISDEDTLPIASTPFGLEEEYWLDFRPWRTVPRFATALPWGVAVDDDDWSPLPPPEAPATPIDGGRVPPLTWRRSYYAQENRLINEYLDRLERTARGKKAREQLAHVSAEVRAHPEDAAERMRSFLVRRPSLTSVLIDYQSALERLRLEELARAIEEDDELAVLMLMEVLCG